MKISFLGNHEVPFSTESDYAWTYEDLGHTVLRFQETGPNPSSTDEIWEQSQDADIFHYVHTHNAEIPGSFDVFELLRRFKEKGIVTIGVHLDFWVGLEREKDVLAHPWWHTDYTFTADGGSNEFFKSKGINHKYLKAGVVKRDCHYGQISDNFRGDVAFIGSYHYHPEYNYRPQLIDWLSDTYRDRFRRYAGDTQWGTIRGSALNSVYASTKITVGDTLNINFSHPDYFSDRLFEATGRGGFVIFPYIKGIEDCFRLGKELITYEYGNFEQLKELIEYYLDHDIERETIRLAGHHRTIRDHTYHNRVEEIFDILKQDGRI